MLSVIAVFAISAGILLAAQSGCIGATLAGTDGSYNTPDTGLSEHAPVQAVTAWEGMPGLIVVCQIADTFADMLFTGVMGIAYAVHGMLVLTPVGSITDDSNLYLSDAWGITTFNDVNGHTYAVVTSQNGAAVQILNITDPANIVGTDAITDSTSTLLGGPRGITSFSDMNGHTYAVVASYGEDGIQILDITDPYSITAAGSISDTTLKLDGATDVDVFKSDTNTYAAVVSNDNAGVQILDITNTASITATSNISDDSSTYLLGAWAITIFDSVDGDTYAAVAAYQDNAVQILNLTDPDNITAAGGIVDTENLVLGQPYGITTFKSGTNTYAAVTSNNEDGIQILDITDPYSITAAGNFTDNGTNNDGLELNAARKITVFNADGHIYAAVTAQADDGVQILDITDPYNIIAASSIPDTINLELDGAFGITVLELNGSKHIAVTARSDAGVQILKIGIAESDTVKPVIKLDGPATVQITTGNPYDEQGAICDDDVDDDKAATVGGDTVDTGTAGIYTVTYTCTDVAGNNATPVNRVVTVQDAADDTAPVIRLTGPATVQITTGNPYDEQGAICDDDVDDDKAATVGGDTVDTGTAGIYTVTYTCTDVAGNNATPVNRVVTVQDAADDTAPVIRLTGPATVQITTGNPYDEQGAICDDDVDDDKAATVGGDTVDTGTAGIYTVTYTCTDVAGNNATPVNRVVTVQDAADDTAPVIRLTGPATVQITTGNPYDEQGAICDDDVDDDKAATVGGDTVDTGTAGIYTVTYTCTDVAGNNATPVNRVVTVQDAADDTAPVIRLTGPATVQITTGNPYDEQGAICDDDVDDDKAATVGGDTVDTGTAGIYTVTYTCTDVAGNNATPVNRVVTVQDAADDTAPVIRLTGPATVQITTGNPYDEQGAICDDDVDDDKAATVGGDTVDTGTAGIYTVTYTCTDVAGNNATPVNRVVTVQDAADDTAPVIRLTGPATVQITTGNPYDEQGAICDDDVDDDKAATVGGDTVDTGTAGIYTVTYTCTDVAGNNATPVNRVVTVQDAADDTAPVIRLTGPATVQITTGNPYDEQGAICDDDVDDDKAATVGGDTVDTGTAGIYTVTYTCTDVAGNNATPVNRVVTVQDAADDTAPVIRLTGPATVQITTGNPYDEQGAICDDDVDDDKAATVGGDTVDTGTAGIYTVTYTCTDVAGNNATPVNRVVTVQDAADDTAPVIRLTGPATVQITTGNPYDEQGAICDDDVDDDKAATVGGDTVDTGTAGIYTVTYTCTDVAGNNATPVNRVVTVQSGPVIDTAPPVITLIGSDTATVTVDTSYNDAGATCRDDVDGSITPTFFSTVDVSQTGTYSVTYSCTDIAGNNATPVSRTVLVHEVGEYQRSSSRSVPLTTDSSMTINGQSYQLGSGTVTIEPYTVTTGHDTDIEFIAYSTEDIIHFTVYLDLHDNDVGYSDRGTYVRYDQGTVKTNDPNGFISYASITITEDEEDSDKKIISVVIEFDGAMGLTNMVVYMWNEDRGSSFIRIFDALDVTAESEPVEPEPRQEPLAPDFADDATDPEPVSTDTLGPDEYDGAQVLMSIRMWSGFASESITDAELLESLNLDYPDADIPDWMMTDLGVLVAKGDVTVDEFVLALQYVLTHA